MFYGLLFGNIPTRKCRNSFRRTVPWSTLRFVRLESIAILAQARLSERDCGFVFPTRHPFLGVTPSERNAYKTYSGS